ncbi:MAG: hypothetical protein U0228_32650 [Myxococcaceae bacterium]
MKRVVLAVMLIVASLAEAGWRPLGAPGGAMVDLTMADAGWVVAVGASGVRQSIAWSDGGITFGNTAGTFRSGVVISNDGCFAYTPGNTTLAFLPAGCGNGRAIRGANVLEVRPWNGDKLVAVDVSGALAQLSYGAVDGGGLFVPPTPATWAVSSVFLRSMHLGDVDYVVANSLAPGLQVSVDGGARTASAIGVALGDLSLFDLGGKPAVMGVTTGGALSLVPDLRLTPTLTPTLPAGFTASRVAMGTDQGIVLSTDGRAASPVPNPASPAQVFRQRPDAGIVFAGFVDCLASTWCAAADSSNQVWLYENAAPPTVGVAPISGPPGAVITIALDAGDADGDPLFSTWTTGASFVATAGTQDGQSIDLTLPMTCGPVPVSVVTTDGLHTTAPLALSVTVSERGGFTLQPSSASLIAGAGGAAATFTASVDGGCDTATFSWSTSDGRSGTGSTFVFPEPATWCLAPNVNVTVTATWNQGVPATSTSTSTLTITPWGPPDTPIFPSPAQQSQLTTQLWVPAGPEHACTGQGSFPGTELVWTNIDAGLATVTPVDGGLLVITPELCTASRVTATARRQVVGESLGRLSGASVLDIDLPSAALPLDATANYTANIDGGGGVVWVDTNVVTNCIPSRGLGTEITVFDGPTAVVGPTFMPTPGAQAFPIAGGCAGGAREVVARLFEDGGFTGASRQATVFFAPAPVALGELTSNRLVAQCGSGAQGSVELLIPPGACASADVAWKVASGPALTVTAGTGTTATLATVDTGFASVGVPLVLEWSIDAGAGNATSDVRTVEIGVDPFVEVSARTFPLLAREESALDVQVQLKNRTDCAVDGLDVSIPLTQGTPLEGSVLVDGVRTDATIVDGALRLANVHLDASGSTTVRFAARPRLLSSPFGTADVSLRGNPVVFIPDPRSPGTQPPCGCSALDGTLVLVALGLLVRRRFRAGRVVASPPRAARGLSPRRSAGR